MLEGVAPNPCFLRARPKLCVKNGIFHSQLGFIVQHSHWSSRQAGKEGWDANDGNKKGIPLQAVRRSLKGEVGASGYWRCHRHHTIIIQEGPSTRSPRAAFAVTGRRTVTASDRVSRRRIWPRRHGFPAGRFHDIHHVSGR